MAVKTLFLTLRTFSATGGIEKVSRVVGKSLYEMGAIQPANNLSILSMYDGSGEVDERYFPLRVFTGFGKKKSRFVLEALRQGIKSNQVILSHINLLLAGFLIKIFSPRTRLILFAHGIEVWSPLPRWKQYMLGKCDLVIAVSRFTRGRMIEVHGLDTKKISVLNNCLDPFLQPPSDNEKSPELLRRYGLTPSNIVLITLTRLSSKEQYKGYDNVLYALNKLKKDYPAIKYLIIGKYDASEKQRVGHLIDELQLQDDIVLTGFIPEEELAEHYNIADCYIMPSKKEGFGIVFIEAMYYGKPVIAGNKDGSADALDNGRFGVLINPDDKEAITGAIRAVINNKAAYVPDTNEVKKLFGYEGYREKLWGLLAPWPSNSQRGDECKKHPNPAAPGE